MDPWGHSEYGDRFASEYDRRFPSFEQERDCLKLLSSHLEPGARIVELGAGTGRVAIPLARAGYRVCAIDGSAAMLSRLRSKGGGANIDVIEADIGTCALPSANAVLCVFNTFFQLQTQDQQTACFKRVYDALCTGGIFALDVWVPDFTRYRERRSLVADIIELDGVTLLAGHHDPIEQVVESQSIRIGDQGVSLQPLRQRYAWPSELDLMARLAGLQRVDRFSDWAQAPFDAASNQNLTIYVKPY